jgi:trimethylamine:corrinoid methyltransferase-like protein
MIRIAHGLTAGSSGPLHRHQYQFSTQLDIPMADGIVDRRQVLIITPFTLAGAMAPSRLGR